MRAPDAGKDDCEAPAADEAAPAARLPWLIGALGALVIHAGCVALAYGYREPDEGDDLGARAIEIGVELAAPQRDPTDLPAGPDADASAASAALTPDKTEVEETDLPKAVPTETDDPDRLVTREEIDKPQDEARETQQTAISQASAGAEAKAMPSPPTADAAPRSAAPDPGTGESLRRVRTTWQKELAVHLDQYKRYPLDRTRQAAEIVVRFVLDRTGHVLSAEVEKSSGDASFDSAALAMMRRADPVPPPPPLVADEGLSFSLPVIFRVKGRT